MFDLKHLEGASSDLVRSMFKVGRKAVGIGARKITDRDTKRKEVKSDENDLRIGLKMLGKAGGKGGPAKNPKETKREPDDVDDNDFSG